MGFKEGSHALAADQNHITVSSRPPPDPGSRTRVRSHHFTSQIVQSLGLLAGLVPSVSALSFTPATAPYHYSITWCLRYLWFSCISLCSQWTTSTLASLTQVCFIYWQFLFVWAGLVAVCFALSRLQRLARTAVTLPVLHFGPFSLGCGYYLLWWLSHYYTLLGEVTDLSLWWFLALQTVPVYGILARGCGNALSFWTDWLLARCLVPHRRAEPSMFVCGYTGSWYCEPRRRRRRGESPIRMPRLYTAVRIPSVLHGFRCSAVFAIRVWSLFLSSLLEKSSSWLVPKINDLAMIWSPLRVSLYFSLNAAYLAWALMVLLDLIVPPWWYCSALSSLYAALRWVLQPPLHHHRSHF